MKKSKIQELEEQYLNLLISIYEGTAANKQLLGFRQALKIILSGEEMDTIVENAVRRSEKIISQL